MQQSLNLETATSHTDLGDGCYLDLYDALTPDAAQRAFTQLRDELPFWQEVYHRGPRNEPIPAPRLTSFHGDPDCRYTYSGVHYAPHAWHPVLTSLRARVSALTGQACNSVLCNLYRDGRDSVGFHADDEPELGPRPDDVFIASLSLGAPRRFVLKHRRTADRHVYMLGHGQLLVMRGRTQTCYVHAVPKTRLPVPPRLNLTFRVIFGGSRGPRGRARP